jgi:hypothetical protein
MRIKVEFELEIPDNISDDDITEWLEFELNANGRMKTTNPLHRTLLEPNPFTVDWDDLDKF